MLVTVEVASSLVFGSLPSCTRHNEVRLLPYGDDVMTKRAPTCKRDDLKQSMHRGKALDAAPILSSSQ